MKPLSMDTSGEVEALQRRRLAAMSFAERGDLVVSLCDATTEAAITGIRLQYPDADEQTVKRHLLVRRYGSQFADSIPEHPHESS